MEQDGEQTNHWERCLYASVDCQKLLLQISLTRFIWNTFGRRFIHTVCALIHYKNQQPDPMT